MLAIYSLLVMVPIGKKPVPTWGYDSTGNWVMLNRGEVEAYADDHRTEPADLRWKRVAWKRGDYEPAKVKYLVDRDRENDTAAPGAKRKMGEEIRRKTQFFSEVYENRKKKGK